MWMPDRGTCASMARYALDWRMLPTAFWSSPECATDRWIVHVVKVVKRKISISEFITHSYSKSWIYMSRLQKLLCSSIPAMSVCLRWTRITQIALRCWPSSGSTTGPTLEVDGGPTLFWPAGQQWANGSTLMLGHRWVNFSMPLLTHRWPTGQNDVGPPLSSNLQPLMEPLVGQRWPRWGSIVVWWRKCKCLLIQTVAPTKINTE